MPGIGNPFYSTILEAVVTEAASRGYGVLVTGRLGDDPARWLSDYFLSSRADGLLLFDGFPRHPQAPRHRRRGLGAAAGCRL